MEGVAVEARVDWLARLQQMGLTLPPAPRPVAAYVPAVRVGELIFVSGQLPSAEGQLRYRGRLGADLGVEEGKAAARLCVLNALAAATTVAPGGPAGIAGVVRVDGFVQCTPDFHEQPQVLNGASELLGALFPGEGHARVAVGCAALPLDAAVEVAVTFRVAGGA
jgi:enamine deaminase RidA (YjgF/YER057c/UK114 family)